MILEKEMEKKERGMPLEEMIGTFKFEVLWENEKTADVDVGIRHCKEITS